MLLMRIPQFFYCGCQHGGYGKEEREFGCGLPGELLAHTTNDGCGASAQTGEQDRKDLETTDLKCNTIGNLTLVVDFWRGKPFVHKQKYDTASDHHSGNEVEIIQCTIDVFAQQNAKDQRGDNGND